MPGRVTPDRTEPTAPAHLLPLLRELGDLKRIRSAGRDGSIATRLFVRAWSDLVGGVPPADVARATIAAALRASRLGDLDETALAALGLAPDEASSVLRAALDEVAGPVDPGLFAWLAGAPVLGLSGAEPDFVHDLAEQPRAGVTCPGKPRIVLQPPENHAEHCLVVAVYGVLLAPGYGADAATVFLAAGAHHLHNAAMPDAGFTGETLLGQHLGPVMKRATEAALVELPDTLRDSVEAALAILADDSTPEGRAFHAADVLDRVLEIDQHLVAAGLTMDKVLGEMALVHDSPVKGFHDQVLAEFGLL